MRTIDISRRAVRGLRNAKARTILTSLAIAVGAFTVTISLAAGEGARQYADKLISSNVNPQALFIVKDNTLFDGSAQQAPIREYSTDTASSSAGVTIEQLTQKDVDTIASRDDIAYVTAIYSPKVEFVQFGDTGAPKFSASVSMYDASILSETSSGSLPVLNTQIKDDEIIVPGSFVDTLVEKNIVSSESELIGKKIILTVQKPTVTPSSEEVTAAFLRGGQDAVQALLKPEAKEINLKVVAVTKKAATALNSVNALQISSNLARQIAEYSTEGTAEYQSYFGATAIVKEGLDPEEVKQNLESAGYYAKTAKDLQGVVFSVVNTLQGIVLGFGIIALIASVFGIINTQYISVLERTREIGLMKALGMRGRSVSRLFQFEAAWIGFLGGIIGSGIAVVLGVSLNPWMTETLELGEGNAIVIFDPITVAVVLVSLVFIAMVAGWFPARKAANLDPIEALRTE